MDALLHLTCFQFDSILISFCHYCYTRARKKQGVKLIATLFVKTVYTKPTAL